ncbi:MAG: hypothetical protein AAB442_02415 [Patescibacteria group bacterium]
MPHLSLKDSGLTVREYTLLKRLSTPIKIQDYLDTLAMNWEKQGDTHRSPRETLKAKKAHCIEGALLAATALWIRGEPPLIMNLSPKMGKGDFDHVVALYKRGACYGAISKTNHSVLRFRDPIYKTPRELALTYFHEWFLPSGERLLECYSKPLDLRRFGTSWVTAPTDLWHIAETLSVMPHYNLVPKGHWRHVRRADPIELAAARTPEWPRSHPRT